MIDIRGDLHAKAESGGQGLILTDEKSNEILRYKNLKVWDADNRAQTARMKVSDNQVLLEPKFRKTSKSGFCGNRNSAFLEIATRQRKPEQASLPAGRKNVATSRCAPIPSENFPAISA